MMTEDFGGHCVSGPASPCDMEELRSFGGVNEAVRGAAFLGRFASAEQKHPVGIVTTFLSLHGDLCLGWPQFHSTGDHLDYQGPLPRDSPCFNDRDLGECVHLGTHPLCHLESLRPSFPWGSGCGANFGFFVFKFTLAGLFKFLFSFVYSGDAASVIYGLVFSRSLSRSLLREHADSSLADLYLSCAPDGPLAVGRSFSGTRCQVFSLSSLGCSRL